jgi:RNA polymerase sigma-70 factor (ECF subfamily)
MGFDAHLLQRFRAGDPDAMGEVYRRHVGSLTRQLRAAAFRGQTFASLRSAVELENVILEVFSRAFEPRARAVYDGQRPYEAFLMGIARNVLLERARSKEQPVGLAPQDEVVLAFEGDGADVHATVEDREVDGLLRVFREGLDGDEARLYDARFVEGLPQEQAAERLGQTRIQLRRREHKLRLRLLEYLQAHGYLGQLKPSGWAFVKESV